MEILSFSVEISGISVGILSFSVEISGTSVEILIFSVGAVLSFVG
jgi:hypothetical protein